MREEIGKRITDIRINMNMSKNQFSKFIGVSAQYLGNVENGKYGLSVEKIIFLSEKTGISADYILLGRDSNIRDKIVNLLCKYDDIQLKTIFKTVKNIEFLTNYKKDYTE